MRTVNSAVLLLGALLAAACDVTGPDGDAIQIRPEIVALAPAASSGALQASVRQAGSEGGATITSDVELLSLRIPVTEITLYNEAVGHNERGAIRLYQCEDGDVTGCYVELVGGGYEKDLLSAGAVSLPETLHDEYDAITFGLCSGEDPQPMLATAEVVLDGTRYYTKADRTLSTVGPAEETTFPGGSSCASYFPLPKPLDIAGLAIDTATHANGEFDGHSAVVPVRLYVDTRLIAWAGLLHAEDHVYYPGGCTGTAESVAAGEPYLCASYPEITGMLGSELPAIERYDLGLNAVIGLVVAPDGLVGGYVRRYFAGEVHPDNFSGAYVATIMENADGSLDLRGPENEEVQEGTTPFWRLPAFERAPHSGTLDAWGWLIPYTAVPLD